MKTRKKASKRSALRSRAHGALDEILNLYEEGADLWLVGQVDWSGKNLNHSLVLVIRPGDPWEDD